MITKQSEHTAKPKLNSLALFFVMVFPSLITWLYFYVMSSETSDIQQLAFSSFKVLQFSFPLIWVALFYKERLSFIKLRKVRGAQIALSVGFGLMVVFAMSGLYFGVIENFNLAPNFESIVQNKVSSLGLNTPLKFLALGLFYSLGHSLLEEYYWRWFTYELWKTKVSKVLSNIFSSLGFMAHHVLLLGFFFGWSSPLTYFLSISVAVGGSFWAWQYEKTDRLFLPWISHMVVDAGIFGLGFWLVKSTFH